MERIDGGRVKFRGIYLLRFESARQTAARHQHNGGTGPRHDAAAKAEDPHAQSFEVGRVFDLFCEPAAGFGAAKGARHDMDVEPGVVVHFLVKRPAIALFEPGKIFASLRAEGKT